MYVYLSELLVPYEPSRSLRSENKHLLIVPKTNYAETAKRAFGVIATSEWNMLPVELRSTESVRSFKAALKTYLFKRAYGL